MFACQQNHHVQVVNFYTAELTDKMLFKYHKDTVISISWLEDDTGFVTTGKDNLLLLWRLFPGTGDGVGK